MTIEPVPVLEEKQREKDLLERLQLPQQEPPPAPWEPRLVPVRKEEWRRKAGFFRGKVAPEPTLDADFDPTELFEVKLNPKELRRQKRDHERLRVAMENFAHMVSYYETGGSSGDAGRQRAPSQRQLRLARKALERFAQQFEEEMLPPEEPPEQEVHPLGFEDSDARAGAETRGSASPAAADAAAGSDPLDPPGTGEAPHTVAEEPATAAKGDPPPPQRLARGPLRRLVDWLIIHL